MANDTFHALKLSPDLIHLQEKGNRQRAKELDRLVNQKAEALEHRQYPGKRFSQIFKKVFGGR